MESALCSVPEGQVWERGDGGLVKHLPNELHFRRGAKKEGKSPAQREVQVLQSHEGPVETPLAGLGSCRALLLPGTSLGNAYESAAQVMSPCIRC